MGPVGHVAHFAGIDKENFPFAAPVAFGRFILGHEPQADGDLRRVK